MTAPAIIGLGHLDFTVTDGDRDGQAKLIASSEPDGAHHSPLGPDHVEPANAGPAERAAAAPIVVFWQWTLSPVRRD
jgi:hypothetical protein